MSDLTIGFVPRDRFCKAAESLQFLYDHTRVPFNLVVVDCNIPERFRQEIERVFSGRPNVRVIRTDHYLLTHQAHNLVLGESRSEYLFLMENDNLIEEDCLARLIGACEEHPAEVAVPLIIEQQEDFRKIHFDDRLGHIDRIQTPEGVKREIVSRRVSKEHDLETERRTIGMLETHCVLYRREVFDRIGPFDESLSTRAEVDVSLALDEAEARIVFEPKAHVVYTPPPPIYPEERDYYLFKWDVERAVRNHDHLVKKWNLVQLPNSVDFVKMRRALAKDFDPQVQQQREIEYRSMLDKSAREIASLIPAGEKFILVDDVQWKANEVAKDRQVFPFLERDGQYWGAPPDDDTAIRELERLRRVGASFMVFAEPAFWWFDHYPRMQTHLRTKYPCLLRNERMVVFDLQRGDVEVSHGVAAGLALRVLKKGT
ncbi:MAG: glycosyltransferase [Acidobacteria bacterium]|nr:MAG: glycosyltransferase [Acidobacteriota bacterium]